MHVKAGADCGERKLTSTPGEKGRGEIGAPRLIVPNRTCRAARPLQRTVEVV
jgi:hypothetical protein